MKNKYKLGLAVRLALTGGAAASLATLSPAVVAQEDEDPAEQPRVTVTGSRVLRSSVETPSPVTILTREDIDATGQVSISQVVRNIAANTFGSRKERSGSTAGSTAGVDLRGLGTARTLVLLDGRRMAAAPTLDAAAQNLNLIPFAAVERIEVLRDGASAIYGSDAIAGVVNIILRKDYEGVHATVQFSRPTQEGGDEDMASLIGGVSSAKGNITFGVDYSRKSRIFDRDRKFSSAGISSFGFPGSYLAGTLDMSPSGPPFPVGRFLGTFPDPRCPFINNPFPDTLAAENYLRNNTHDPFPNSVAVASGGGARCRFNYAALSMNEASIRRTSLFVDSNFEITEDTSFFARAITSYNETFGRYAPAPQIGGVPFAPSMAASNPNNPTQGTSIDLPDIDQNFNLLTTSTTYNGPWDLTLFYRNVPGGTRDSFTDDVMFDVVAGFEGLVDWFDGAEWEIAAQHSRIKTLKTSVGFASSRSLQAAIDDGSYDIFGVNGPTSSTVARSFLVDTSLDTETVFFGADAQLRFDYFDLPNGSISWALGFEYQDQEFMRNFDQTANDADVAGSPIGTDINAARTVFSTYGEALIPILSNLELDLALRYDKYNDFGDTTNPKVGVAYRPVESLLLRGTYGEGFRAPTFDDLYGPVFNTIFFARDTTACIAAGDTNGNGIPDVDEDPFTAFPPGHPCFGNNEFPGIGGGNPALGPEESESYTAGFIWSPTPDLSFGLDYYHIEIENESEFLPIQIMLDREAQGDPFFSSFVQRNAMNQITLIDGIIQNIAGRETDGVDFQLSYGFGFDRIGDFQLTGSATYILDYKGRLLFSDPFQRIPFENQTDLRSIVGLGWQRGNFTGQLNWHHIATVTDSLGNGTVFSAWNTFDIQFGWDTPWQGKLSLGARNVTNQDPPLDFQNFGPFPDETLYDVYGRVPYIRYEQDL